MENQRFGLGVFLYIFNQDLSKVLLLELNEQKKLKYSANWGNVGGKIRFGETSLEACVRETKEEIGVKIKNNKPALLYVKELPNFYKNVHGIQFVYGVTISDKTKIVLSPENPSYKWFELRKLPSKLLDFRTDFYKARKSLTEKLGQ